MTTPIHPLLATALHDLFGLQGADLRPEAELEADLHLDSLSIVELQVAVEEAFEVRMGTEDPGALRTLGDLQATIDAAVARGEPTMPALILTEDQG
jgi:acyl carrier protein